MVVPDRTGGGSACPEEEEASVRLPSRSGNCCSTCLRKRTCRSHDVFISSTVWSLLVLLPLYEFKKGYQQLLPVDRHLYVSPKAYPYGLNGTGRPFLNMVPAGHVLPMFGHLEIKL
ncbi:hypothetical protein PAHAL_6G216800 [Panicum hallii]|uniref:Uncharacterized protein n=1 Tax=Panicum hallii TaxID=206008 RepID=A0A2S3I2B9_9POAL|nr:hypothetical protein PAHAL_6G216800 [Panicum hallii]